VKRATNATSPGVRASLHLLTLHSNGQMVTDPPVPAGVPDKGSCQHGHSLGVRRLCRLAEAQDPARGRQWHGRSVAELGRKVLLGDGKEVLQRPLVVSVPFWQSSGRNQEKGGQEEVAMPESMGSGRGGGRLAERTGPEEVAGLPRRPRRRRRQPSSSRRRRPF